MPTPNEYRGHSTATGTTSVTVPVPAGTADNDGLMLAILNDGSSAPGLSVSGWTQAAVASGARFNAFRRVWHTGDPTSVTITPNASTAIVALMYGFENSGSAGSGASIPAGGTDPTKVECPGWAAPLYIAFAGIIDPSDPQATPLTGDAPLVGVENVSSGPLRLAGGFDTTNTSANRFFSGVTSPVADAGDMRAGLGTRFTGTFTYPAEGGWGVGMVRMGAN